MNVARKGNIPRFCKTGVSVQTSLRGIANKAKEKPDYQFRNLYGMIDVELLRRAWKELNKKAAAGVDQVTAREYEQNLDANLADLVDRLIRNAYRAKLVRRKHIPKGEGKTRALGIPTLEDRLLQKAVAMILDAIYESTFLDCSYGYRSGRSAKDALNKFRDELNFGFYRCVVEADIKGFFDNLEHEWLITMLEERIEDQKLLRLIRKWLNAGILEPDGMVVNPLTGTPQGGIVSPILANVYLHYVLDLWVEKRMAKKLRGRVKYVRYADDFVCAFTDEKDAATFYDQLPGRLTKFGLEVAEDKTRVVRFGRTLGKKNQRFNFLGFELFWGNSRSGKPYIRRRTSRTRVRRAIRETTEWIKSNRSLKLNDLIEALNSKLTGHYVYYGVIGNSSGLSEYFNQVIRGLFKWLNRRSQKKSMTWIRFQDKVRRRLVNPRIMEKRVHQLPLPGFRR